MKMKRVNYHLTLKQIKDLKKISKRYKISVARIIRNAVDNDCLYGGVHNKNLGRK